MSSELKAATPLTETTNEFKTGEMTSAQRTTNSLRLATLPFQRREAIWLAAATSLLELGTT